MVSISEELIVGRAAVSPHWQVFLKSPVFFQGKVGTEPAKIARLLGTDDRGLSDEKLSRVEVLSLCQKSDTQISDWELFITIMAWGAIDKGPRGHGPLRSFASQKLDIQNKIKYTRMAESAEDAYLIWATSPIKELGPAYFTKLLYFLLYPRMQVYVMDVWTARSANLLLETRLIEKKHLYNYRGVAVEASQRYGLFCRFIEIGSRVICRLKNLEISGSDFEVAMFSHGGREAKKGQWRSYVNSNSYRFGPTNSVKCPLSSDKPETRN